MANDLGERISMIVCTCKNCNKKFEINRWRLKDPRRGRFCTHKCFLQFNRGVNHCWFGKKRPEMTGENSPSWKGGLGNCIDCGKKVSTYNPKNGRCLLCSNKSRTGENSPRWRGGVSKLHKTERQLAMQSIEYKLWRVAVFTRDNYICQMCHEHKHELEADHIRAWKDYPELRYAIDNGRTLCRECHMKTETWGVKILEGRAS